MLQLQLETWILLLKIEVALYFVATTTIVLVVPKIVKWKWITMYSGHEDSKRNNTPQIVSRLQVPKYWFWHFYAYTFFLVLCYVSLVLSHSWHSPVLQMAKTELLYSRKAQVSLVLFQIHMLRRLYESLRFRNSGSKMLITHYLLGYFFYSHTFLAILIACLGDYEQYAGWKQGIGLGLYIFGNVWQNASHEHLIAQKHQRSYLPLQKSGFRWIAGSHYFGEVILYTGFLCMMNHWIIWLVYGWILGSMITIATSYSQTSKQASRKPQTANSRPKWIIFPLLY
ncbi:steroid dehydrogenase [Schizosaccharomyces cryophilus OY26]|uniref:Polyprenal reductase n=1 Tax=Schizosaccharomyces cryophilus (strain OY26 / ATCC MYA-4695 / CBS 11777 / NBRC 106824 / NRRL Y48691) TaxID=653667 RepID=S9W249_SCHCR|nr:steroid dehydrogenase [Schizosaccharomyces cryophilus OY26]EPY52429.1 steroid dehydrogenase [Schizosaccharomyces cryophilus OY26]